MPLSKWRKSKFWERTVNILSQLDKVAVLTSIAGLKTISIGLKIVDTIFDWEKAKIHKEKVDTKIKGIKDESFNNR